MTEFEERHEVALPPAYRLFVTGLGDGGAGPGYHLSSLSTSCRPGCLPGHLARPSPYLPGPRYRGDWEQRYEDPPGPDRMFLRGTLRISDHGCTLVTRLVVTGPARGRFEALRRQRGGVRRVHPQAPGRARGAPVLRGRRRVTRTGGRDGLVVRCAQAGPARRGTCRGAPAATYWTSVVTDDSIPGEETWTHLWESAARLDGEELPRLLRLGPAMMLPVASSSRRPRWAGFATPL